MTREQLRQQKISEGWSVPPVSEWQLVSAQGLEPRKYDVNNVFDPNRESYGTATVVVYGEGTAEERAVGQNEWKTGFREDLRTWLDTREGGAVFAISTEQVYENDEVAIVTAYIEDQNGNVTANRYVVRFRSGSFSFMPIV